MKNSKLMIIMGILTLVLVTNRFAGTTLASKKETGIFKQIEQQMPYPEFAKKDQLNGKVTVEFRLGRNGKIEVLNMNYSSPDLKTYVSDQLSKMKIQSTENIEGKVYRVAFSFSMVS